MFESDSTQKLDIDKTKHAIQIDIEGSSSLVRDNTKTLHAKKTGTQN